MKLTVQPYEISAIIYETFEMHVKSYDHISAYVDSIVAIKKGKREIRKQLEKKIHWQCGILS